MGVYPVLLTLVFSILPAILILLLQLLQPPNDNPQIPPTPIKLSHAQPTDPERTEWTPPSSIMLLVLTHHAWDWVVLVGGSYHSFVPLVAFHMRNR